MFAIQDVLTAVIVAVPVAYGAVLTAQFVSGLGKLGNARSTSPSLLDKGSDLLPNSGLKSAASAIQECTAPEVVETATIEGDERSVVPQVADGFQISKAHASKGFKCAWLSDSTGLWNAKGVDAFTPDPQGWVTTDPSDAALVEDAMTAIAAYWQHAPTTNVVEFKRPLRGVQKPQEDHPAIQGLSLRKMRELGARLKIRNARRWNAVQAKSALNDYYRRSIA